MLHNCRALILLDDAYDSAQVRSLCQNPPATLLIISRRRISLPGSQQIEAEGRPG